MCARGWLVPPFASDQNESLDSVFENKGLLKSLKVQLLDVQCKSTLLYSSFIHLVYLLPVSLLILLP